MPDNNLYADHALVKGVDYEFKAKSLSETAIATASQISMGDDVTLDQVLSDMQDEIDYNKLNMNNTKYKRYGVSGVGQSASALRRIWDSVGMVAQVGTDGDNSLIRNDFDDAYPFNWRKCVGYWELVDGRPKFHVNAYLGEEGYTEDGTAGDYVAVECPLSYYFRDGGILAVSGYRHKGFRPFGIFCRDHDDGDLIEKYYAPAYALALKDGHAVSLPGLDNEQGSYYSLTNAARTYGDGTGVATGAFLMPWEWTFYLYAMMTVEFATQNM